MRFHSAPVIRLADAKPMQLGHVALADGAWRLYVFADRSDPTAAIPGPAAVRVPRLRESPVARFTPRTPIPTPSSTSARSSSRAIATCRRAMPPVLLPRKGQFGLIDYEKIFCPDPTPVTSSTCEAQPRTAAWSSCGPTSTSHTSFRWRQPDALTAFFEGDPHRREIGPGREGAQICHHNLIQGPRHVPLINQANTGLASADGAVESPRAGSSRPWPAPGDRRRGGLHRRPRCQRLAQRGEPGRAEVPSVRFAAPRDLRPTAGIMPD